MQEKALALRQIAVLREELTRAADEVRRLHFSRSTPVPISEALRTWRERAVRKINDYISPVEAQNLEACNMGYLAYINPLNPLDNTLNEQVHRYDQFLKNLADAIEADPAGMLIVASSDSTSKENGVMIDPSREDAVFIVHGHDEPNLYKLKELLKDRYGLTPIVLSSQSGGGRTIIEKFEDEAQKAAFAFVLLTPDDIIRKSDREYGQARPNVTFELGWFYGKLGRKKVCILFKRGTEIHSDLNGVSRIEFTEAVNEKVEEIERELVAGGLLEA